MFSLLLCRTCKLLKMVLLHNRKCRNEYFSIYYLKQVPFDSSVVFSDMAWLHKVRMAYWGNTWANQFEGVGQGWYQQVKYQQVLPAGQIPTGICSVKLFFSIFCGIGIWLYAGCVLEATSVARRTLAALTEHSHSCLWTWDSYGCAADQHIRL